MLKYTDLLEQRTSIKAIKETMFKLGYEIKSIALIDEEISRLSIAIRSLKHDDIDESPTQLLSEPEGRVPADFISFESLTTPLTYDRFYFYHKDKIIKSITSQIIDVQVPLGVYAMFKNSIIKSQDYIMKHHYQLYLKGFNNEQ